MPEMNVARYFVKSRCKSGQWEGLFSHIFWTMINGEVYTRTSISVSQISRPSGKLGNNL
jgi:hypothetical protein